MRLSLFALVMGILALGTTLSAQQAATAEKSKMGCDTETEVWSAALGKCEPGTPKYKRKAADTPPPAKTATTAKTAKTAKKAPAAKAAKAAKKAPPAAK